MPPDPIVPTVRPATVRPATVRPATVRPAAARPVAVRPAVVHWFDTWRAERRSPVSEPFPELPSGWTPPPVPAGLARATIGVAVAWGALQLLLLAAAPGEAARRAGAAAAEGTTAYAGVSLGLLGVQLTALLVVGTWVRRGQVFAMYLATGDRPRRGGAWPWFAWALPVVSFWFPYQMVRDLRRETLGDRRAARGAVALGAWWAGWLMLALAANPLVLETVDLRRSDPAVLVSYEIVTSVLTWVAMTLWVRIVREVTNAQEERAAARAAVGLEAAPST